METYNIPQDIFGDNTKRSYTKLDVYGDIVCHYERQSHPDDVLPSADKFGNRTASYYGQWVDLTEQAIAKSSSRTNTNTLAKKADNKKSDIQLPIRLRAVEPDEVAKFIQRHEGQLDIVTVTNKHK